MSRRAAIAALGLWAGCHAGGGGAPGPTSPGAGFTIVERAESAPVTALAAAGPYLWTGGAAGLRRIEIKTGEYEMIGGPGTLGGHDVAALAIDEEGGAWVSTPAEVGRWVTAGGAPRFEGHGAPGPVTVLAAGRPVARAGVWAGGPKGLYWFDGHGWVTVVSMRDITVTSLTLDEGGSAVWVGTASRGVYRAEGEGATPVTGGAPGPDAPGAESIVLDSVVGIARPATGTRLYAGNARGEARLYAQTRTGIEGYRGPQGVHVSGLAARSDEAILLVGPRGAEQPHRLQFFGASETPPPGSVRFMPLRIERAGRWAAIPLDERVPPEVTATATAGNELFVATAHMGVARAAPGGPELLEGSELVGEAEHLFVACVARSRCFVVTDGPRARETDGDRYRTVSVGEPEGATVIAVARDGQGAVYAISSIEKPATLAISLYVAAGPGGREDWRLLHKVPLTLPAGARPAASFAAVSPGGTLWLGLRAVNQRGDEAGYGVAEIDLGTGHAVQHRPHRADEKVAAEALPLPASLTGVLFEGGSTWFSSLSGVYRWHEGQLRAWTENDGLASESVHGIGRGPDDKVWAATSEGLTRFDGRDWRTLGTEELALRGLAADGKGRVWIASSKGLRLVDGKAATIDPGAAPVVLPGDMRDVMVDRFGRVWVMSSASIALVEER